MFGRQLKIPPWLESPDHEWEWWEEKEDGKVDWSRGQASHSSGLLVFMRKCV